jgi:hypothetical protein
LTVTDFLPLFCARNDAPISRWFERRVGTQLPRQIAVLRNFDLDRLPLRGSAS